MRHKNKRMATHQTIKTHSECALVMSQKDWRPKFAVQHNKAIIIEDLALFRELMTKHKEGKTNIFIKLDMIYGIEHQLIIAKREEKHERNM
jgi:hypothetical protein